MIQIFSVIFVIFIVIEIFSIVFVSTMVTLFSPSLSSVYIDTNFLCHAYSIIIQFFSVVLVICVVTCNPSSLLTNGFVVDGGDTFKEDEH